jgi:hypothetical protein
MLTVINGGFLMDSGYVSGIGLGYGLDVGGFEFL